MRAKCEDYGLDYNSETALLILGVDPAGLRAARQLELNGCSSWRLLEAAHAQAARHTLRIAERCRRPL
jgi:hypothetical protein